MIHWQILVSLTSLRCDESELYDIAHNSEELVPFHLSESPQSPVFGLLRPVIVEQLKLENERSKQLNVAETRSLRLEVSFRRRVILGPASVSAGSLTHL